MEPVETIVMEKDMDLKNVFSNVNGNTIIGLTTKTNVTLRGGKKNSMQGRVTKVMTGANVMIFQNKNVNGYENMVRRRLEQEGKNPDTFVLGERPWGHRIEGTPIIEHNGKQYLEVIFLKPGKVEYFLDDEPIEKEQIEGLDEPKDKTINEEAQGGLENKVTVRTFAKDSIVSVTIGGETV